MARKPEPVQSKPRVHGPPPATGLILPADGSTITTVAGSGTGGAKDSENAAEAQFYGLEGVSVSPDGKTIFVADGNRGEDMPYNRIRIIKL